MSNQLLRSAVQCGWLPLAVFCVHAFCSKVLNAYEVFPPLDIPMHFVGGFAIAYFFWHGLDSIESFNLIQHSSGVLRLVLVFALSSTAAVLWEFAEFISDQLFDTSAQKGLEDTLFDMFLGMVGAAVYLCAIVIRKEARGLKRRVS